MEIYRVMENLLPSGMRTVKLENKSLSVTLLPDKGADIYSIQHKEYEAMNILYRSPWQPRSINPTQRYGTPEEQWMDHYPGGWQMMFPNAGAECRYKGSTQEFHGEASMVPWEYRIDACDRKNASVTFKTNLTRTPFELEKKVSLESDEAVLRVNIKITNLSEVPVDYVWGHHIAFGAPFLSEHCTLQIPADRMTSDRQTASHCRLDSGSETSWPMAKTRSGQIVNFSQLPPAQTRSTDMAFLNGMKEGWYVLTNKEKKLNIGVGWELDAFPYVWLWQEFRGSLEYPFYGRGYVMGVEPCSTPISDGLAVSVEKGFASSLLPGASRETTLTMVLFPYSQSQNIRQITKEGRVVFA